MLNTATTRRRDHLECNSSALISLNNQATLSATVSSRFVYKGQIQDLLIDVSDPKQMIQIIITKLSLGSR